MKDDHQSEGGLSPTKLWSLVAAVSLLYLFLSSPDGLVVSPKGDVKWITNRARAVLQGRSFWVQQLGVAQRQLSEARAAPEREAQGWRELEQAQRELDRETEYMYRRAPHLRPSRAEALRERADRIEEQEAMAQLRANAERSNKRWISDLEQIIPKIEARLH